MTTISAEQVNALLPEGATANDDDDSVEVVTSGGDTASIQVLSDGRYNVVGWVRHENRETWWVEDVEVGTFDALDDAATAAAGWDAFPC